MNERGNIVCVCVCANPNEAILLGVIMLPSRAVDCLTIAIIKHGKLLFELLGRGAKETPK